MRAAFATSTPQKSRYGSGPCPDEAGDGDGDGDGLRLTEGLTDGDGDVEEDGLSDGDCDGDTDDDGDLDADGETLGLADALGDTDGDADADELGLLDADGLTDGLDEALGLAEADGDFDADGETLGDAEADGLTDAEGLTDEASFSSIATPAHLALLDHVTSTGRFCPTWYSVPPEVSVPVRLLSAVYPDPAPIASLLPCRNDPYPALLTESANGARLTALVAAVPDPEFDCTTAPLPFVPVRSTPDASSQT